MYKLLILISSLSIALLSCDGRDRTYKSNVEILKSNNLFESFSKQVNFIPNLPVEIFTDTILSNGFQVKINYYSVENSFISKHYNRITFASSREEALNFNADAIIINASEVNEFGRMKIESNIFLGFEIACQNHNLVIFKKKGNT